MRIAYVYDAVYPEITGGVERRVWELARRLAARGHEVHLFGMHLWEGETTITRDGVVINGICRPLSFYRKGKRRILPAFIFGIMVFSALARERFDVVDCQQFPYTSVLGCAAACRISRSPLVITWHEVWGDYWYDYLGIPGAVGKWIERIVAILPAFRIAVSETTADGLRDIDGRGNITIIPNGISSDKIDAVRPSVERSDLIFVGRLIPEKHVDVLIDAVALLAAHIPDIRCLVIGDGPEREYLEQKSRLSGLGSHVAFTGILPRSRDVIAYLKSSRVFVFPSTREGFGIAVLEALACGLPVVTIDHPKNASRVFAANRCGVLSTLDPSDLSGKILSVLEGSSVSAMECRTVARRYDWEVITDMIDEYYHGVHEKESVRSITLKGHSG